MGFNYNRVTIVGCITRDPEFKMVSGGRLFFVVAVRRNLRPVGHQVGNDYSDFIPVVIWGRLAGLGKQLLKSGSPVLVEGRLQTRHYNTGDFRRYFTEVIGSNFQLLSSKGESEESHISEALDDGVV
jgi:single-strand DNA-binding protein